jgi:ATP-dependent RNA helicase DDX49/DBP8
VLPILQKLAKDPYGIFAIVLTPARELAMQISEQIVAFGSECGVQVSTVIGGMDLVKQGIEVDAKPHFIVATPGRLADLVRCRNEAIISSEIAFLVLDEADRLLSPEFAEDLGLIIQEVSSSNPQTLLFSATLDSVENLDREMFPQLPKEFTFVSTSDTSMTTVDDVDQRYMFIPAHAKDSYLVHLLKNVEEYQRKDCSIIIFVSMKKTCEIISAMLTQLEISNVALHAGISQTRRLASLGKFRSRLERILVATDVASRGLDIPSVDLVINYDLPYSGKEYVHRIGRTGRAGKRGDSITLITPKDVQRFLDIEKMIAKKLTEFKVSDDSVAELMKSVNPAKRIAQIRLEEYLDKQKDLKRKNRS